MNHEDYLDWISRDLDDDLSMEEKRELYKHLVDCASCRAYQEDLQRVTQELKATPALEMDASVKAKTMEHVQQEKRKNVSYRRWLPIAASVLVVFVLVSPLLGKWFGGRFSSSDGENVNGGGTPPVTGGVVDKDGGGGVAPDKGEEGGDTGRDVVLDEAAVFDPSKIIYTGNLSLYTENLKKSMEEIAAYIGGLGGFIQQSNANVAQKVEESGGKTGYMLLRIKSSDFDVAMKDLEKYGDVINTSVNTTNITQQYQDIKGELDSYLIQQDRLLTYLGKAETIQDMLVIEEQLTRVRNEINVRASLIKNWDTQVAFSTIQVQLYERAVSVTKVTSPFEDFAIRIRDAFVKSINYLLASLSNLIILVIAILPFALVLGVAALIGRMLWKKRKK
jgi:hypothetical protein